MSITKMDAVTDLIEVRRTGYSQPLRTTLLDEAGHTIRWDKDTDCSFGSGVIAALAYGRLPMLKGTFYSGNFAQRMRDEAGFTLLRFGGLAQVRHGDFLVGPGHVVYVRAADRWWSAESDERGKSGGGKPGDQTGREAYFRAPYLRSAGWTYIVRPPDTGTALVLPSGKVGLETDGAFGRLTIAATQRWLGVTDDGSWGPKSKRALQTRLGVKIDDQIGPITVRALQRLVGAKVDGAWGRETTRALQRYLNARGAAL